MINLASLPIEVFRKILQYMVAAYERASGTNNELRLMCSKWKYVSVSTLTFSSYVLNFCRIVRKGISSSGSRSLTPRSYCPKFLVEQYADS